MKRWRCVAAGLFGAALVAVVAAWVTAQRGLHPADVKRVQVGMNPAEVADALGRPPDLVRTEEVKEDDPRRYMGHLSPPVFDRVDNWESGSTVITVGYWRDRVIWAEANDDGYWSELVESIRSGF
jgi:hypothetical protein